ncbi:hypothetical protein ACFE04_027958 [Oxalis oulophora]
MALSKPTFLAYLKALSLHRQHHHHRYPPPSSKSSLSTVTYPPLQHLKTPPPNAVNVSIDSESNHHSPLFINNNNKPNQSLNPKTLTPLSFQNLSPKTHRQHILPLIALSVYYQNPKPIAEHHSRHQHILPLALFSPVGAVDGLDWYQSFQADAPDWYQSFQADAPEVSASLESIANELLAKHSDIGTGNSPFPYMNEMAFIILCGALKSMDTTRSTELTEMLILKWRDVVRGALHSGFKINFFKDHLKLVTRAYLAMLTKNSRESKALKAIDVKISTKRKELNALIAQHVDVYKKMKTALWKTCEEAASKNFPGETYGYFSI